MSRSCHLGRGVFQAPEVGLLSGPVSLGPPFAKSQKTADLGVLGQFVRTRRCGHFWSRRLRQKVFRCFHFERILISRSCHLRRGVFQAPEVGLLFGPVSLAPPFAKSQKTADLGVLGQFVRTRRCRHFWSRRLRQKVIRCLHFERILMSRSCHLRRGVFQAPEVGLLFGPVSLGPPFAKSQKTADLGVLGQFVRTRRCGHFWSRRLRQKVVRCLHFERILMSRSCHLGRGVFQAPEVGLLSGPVSLGPPFAKSQKTADLGVLGQFVRTRRCGHFWSRPLRQKVIRCLHFERILMSRSCHLRRGVFQAPEVGLLFGPVSLGPPFAKSQKTADLGVLGQFVRTRRCGHFWSRRLRQKVIRCLHFERILMSRSCHLRRGVFQAPEVGLLFGPVSLGPPFAKSQKTADLGVLGQFVRTRRCGHFWSRRLRQKVVRCLHFERILMSRSCYLRRGVFQAPEVGLLSGPVSLGPPFAKSQKTADLGVLGQFVRTRRCGHFWSRRLRQKVIRCLHFERILMSRSCHLRRGVFQAPEVGLLFGPVSLGPPFAKSQKTADLGVLGQFVRTRRCGHFWSRRLRQKVIRCLHFERILMSRSCHLRRGVFQAPEVGLLSGPVSLGPPFAKSQKTADLGVLGQFVRTRRCGHFWSRRLRQKVIRCFHFERILMSRSCHLRRGVFQAPEVGLLFGPVSLGPPFAKSQKTADLGVLGQFVRTRRCGHFWSRRLRQKVIRCLHFERILMSRSCHLRRGVFQAPEVGLLFGPVSLGPPFAKSQETADLGVLGQFVRTRRCGHFWSRRLSQKVIRCLHFERILMSRSCHLRRGVFQAPEVGLLFGPVSLAPPFAKSQKTADLGVLGQFVRTRRCGHFWSRRLRQKVIRCLHFERILMSRSCHLRRGVFQAPEVGLLSGPVSLGPPFAKSQKTADLGVLGQVVRTRRCGHFWSRRLRQKVIRCLHFERILMSRSCHLRRGVFQAP